MRSTIFTQILHGLNLKKRKKVLFPFRTKRLSYMAVLSVGLLMINRSHRPNLRLISIVSCVKRTEKCNLKFNQNASTPRLAKHQHPTGNAAASFSKESAAASLWAAEPYEHRVLRPRRPRTRRETPASRSMSHSRTRPRMTGGGSRLVTSMSRVIVFYTLCCSLFCLS